MTNRGLKRQAWRHWATHKQIIRCLALVLILGGWNANCSFAQSGDAGNEKIPLDSSITQLQELDDLPIVTIDKIFILGNNTTKKKIIHRELSIREGEQMFLSALKEQIKKDRRKLINTELFLDVNFNIVNLPDNRIDLIIRVKERWYTVPSPILQLADRNFNDWIVNQNRELDRLEYGLKFFQYNFRGLNERLYLYAQFGFTNKYALRYVVPYVDKAQKNGFDVNFAYIESNDISYVNRNNKLIFTENARKMQTSIKGNLSWNHRSSFYNNHSVTTTFYYSSVEDTITQNLNPDYYFNNQNYLRALELNYEFSSDHRDNVNYPLRGYAVNAEVSKQGMGIFNDVNLFSLEGSYSKFLDLGSDFYLAGKLNGYFSTPYTRPYIYNHGLGYNENWPRGYELYVVEGQNYLFQQTTLRKKIFSRELFLEPIIPIDQFNRIPLAIYLKTYFDSGYLHNPQPGELNKLANEYMYSGGFGLDIVSFYGLVLRFEYSMNNLGEHGLFFHFGTPF